MCRRPLECKGLLLALMGGGTAVGPAGTRPSRPCASGRIRRSSGRFTACAPGSRAARRRACASAGCAARAMSDLPKPTCSTSRLRPRWTSCGSARGCRAKHEQPHEAHAWSASWPPEPGRSRIRQRYPAATGPLVEDGREVPAQFDHAGQLPSWQVWRIAQAAASSTANIGRAWTRLPTRSKQPVVPPCPSEGTPGLEHLPRWRVMRSPKCRWKPCSSCGPLKPASPPL